MLAPQQITPPANWQDFESLCKKLWGEIWSCPDTIKKNGKQGDTQNGVDIYAKVGGKYYGIQCKLKEQLTDKQLTNQEIDKEIEKARSFRPNLSKLIFATTATKNAGLEEYVRLKDQENSVNGGFEIELYSWDDIVDLILENKGAYDWYVHNVQFERGFKVRFTMNNGTELEVRPHFVRQEEKVYYIGPAYDCHDWHAFEQASHLFNQTLKKYNSVRLRFLLENIGDTMLENYRIEVVCPYKDADISNMSDRHAPIRVCGTIDHSQIDFSYGVRVFGDEYNVAHLGKVPLVQQDTDAFAFDFTPAPNLDTVELKWKLLAKDYNTQGLFVIQVNPSLTYIPEVVPVYTTKEIPDGYRQLTLEELPKLTVLLVEAAKKLEEEYQNSSRIFYN